MPDTRLAAARRWPARMAALALLYLAGLSTGVALLSEAPAQAARGPQQVAGVWEASWENSRGDARKGLIVIEQSGTALSARIESHGNVTATGTLAGESFTLRGSRLGVPFTISGRVKGRKMAGMLTAILIERRFTATRRRAR